MYKLAAAALILIVSLPAAAQPAGKGSAATGAAAQAAPERREKVKQRIRALRAYELTEQLDLDEATAAKLFPALSKYDDEFDKLLQTRADLQKQLVAAGAVKDAKELDKLIDATLANQRALWDTEDKRLQQLRKILTPAQTAKILVVLPAMERKIQNQLRRAAQPAQPGAKAAPQNPNDDLSINPFGKAANRHRDDLERPGKGSGSKPCDPFETVHGCK